MNIFLYIDDEEHTPIDSFFDMQHNPFKLGDELKLKVVDIYPIEFNKYREEYKKNLLRDCEERKKIAHLKTFKIVKGNKYVDIRIAAKSAITIEYFCTLID